MKRFLMLVFILALAGLMVAGCGGQKKKLVIGLDDNFPPMGFRDDKNVIVGFDIDLAKEAAKRLNMDVEFKPIDWNSKEVELNSKRIDMIWNGLTVTEKRKENILFSQPYMENGQIVVVLANSPIKTKADLAGKVVGTQEGSSSIDSMQKEPQVFNSLKELKKYPDNIAAFMDLASGRVDAIVLDELVGRYYITKKAKNPSEYRVLEQGFAAEQMAVGMRKGDTELQAKLQKVLDEMKKDGTSAKISKQWFGVDMIK